MNQNKYQPTPNKSKWVPSPNYLAQNTHILASMSIIFFANLQNWPIGWIYLVLLIGTAFKEFVLDTLVLEGDSWWGSAEDFLFYQVGVLLAVLACLAPIMGILCTGFLFLVLTLRDVIAQEDHPNSTD